MPLHGGGAHLKPFADMKRVIGFFEDTRIGHLLFVIVSFVMFYVVVSLCALVQG